MSARPQTVRQLVRSQSFERFKTGWQKDFAPRRKRKPSEWATQVRIIPAGTSPLARGYSLRYDHSRMPHLVEIMDAADDPSIRKIVMWFAIREGKTMGVCANIFGRDVTDDPRNTYSVHPVEDDADRFSEGDVEPMITETPELCGLFVAKKSRDSGRTKSFKKFRGGWLRIVSSGADTAFRGTSVGLLMLHELDALDKDSINAAIGRTTGFPNATIIMESTGTLAAEINPDTGLKEYRSNIEQEYDQGDKRKRFHPCQACGFLQLIEYEGIKFPKGEPEKAKYECVSCGHLHEARSESDEIKKPSEWRNMCVAGRWYPTAGLTEDQEKDIEHTHHLARAIDPSVRSYWKNGFTSLLPHHEAYTSKLHEFAAQGEAALAGQESDKRIWTQERAAKLWNPTSESEPAPAWRPIYEGREDYAKVPARACYLTAFVDCQLNRLEGGWRAWGPNEENWGLKHFVVEGAVRDPETWKKLKYELAKKWEHESGAVVRLGIALIDGGDYAEDVYKFMGDLAREPMEGVSGHVRASKGFGRHGHPVVDRTFRTVAKSLKGHHIGTWEAKDRIYERLRASFGAREDTRKDIQEGRMHFNLSYDEGYCQQLVSEQVVIVYDKGIMIRKYENLKRVRNEALDIEVGNLAAFRLYPHNMEALAQQIKDSAPQPEQPRQRRVERQEPAQVGGTDYALGGLRW